METVLNNFCAEGLNVLSCFDGMSCGQLALQKAGIKVKQYYASEIDKYAIQVTQKNFPDTIQLGDVTQVKGADLPKIDLLCGGSPCQSFSFAGKRKGMSTKCETEILTLEHYLELKAEGYEFEGQSYLFWEYMRLLNETRPKYFLLENVIMGEKWEKILSKAIGVNAIEINSALVSAQNRRRLYWTNIGMQPMGLFGDFASIIPQPKYKGILLKDILETDVADKYFLSGKMLDYLNSRKANYNNGKINYKTENDIASCINASSGAIDISDNIIIDTNRKARWFTAGGNSGGLHSQMDLVVHNTMPRSSKTGKGGTGPLSRNDGKTYCLDTGNTNAIEMVGAIKFGRTDEAKALRKESMKNGKDYTPFQAKEISGIDYEKMGTLTTVQKDNLVEYYPCDYRSDEGFRIRANGKAPTLTRGAETSGTQYNSLVMQLNPSTESGGKQPYQQNRIYDTDGISPALMAQMSCGTHAIKHERKIRRLTPLECERLQTVPDIENNVIFALCYEQAKNYVNAVSQNPKLLKLVLDAEQSELNELVKSVWLNMNVNHQSIKHTAQLNADMPIQQQTNQFIKSNPQESNITASSAGNTAISNGQNQGADIVPQNVFISITEGKITHCGQEVLLPNANHSTIQKNGGNPLKMFGKEIMQIVEDVEKSLNIKKDNNFISITSNLLSIKNLEQALIIYYLFAKNVITGFTPGATQIKSLSLRFSLKDGYTSCVSDSQRYRMLGNGWTVSVVSHIFSYLPKV